MSFANASKVEQACTKGIHEDKRMGLRNTPVSLTSWINLVSSYMEECGMDTVFNVYDEDLDELCELEFVLDCFDGGDRLALTQELKDDKERKSLRQNFDESVSVCKVGPPATN